ncbi:MAG: hypothetical protein ACK5BX_32295, partial [Bradyrhizobium sp.]
MLYKDAVKPAFAATAEGPSTVDPAEIARFSRLAEEWWKPDGAFKLVPAFNAAPSVYRERAYFAAFSRAATKPRKYVLLTTNTQDVIQF